MTPRLAVLESPLAGNRDLNKRYARACMLDILRNGDWPYASHLLFDQPGLLDDTIPEDRELGMNACSAWSKAAEIRFFYFDLGVSSGMLRGLREAIDLGQQVLSRCLVEQVGTCLECGVGKLNAWFRAAETRLVYDSRPYGYVVSRTVPEWYKQQCLSCKHEVLYNGPRPLSDLAQFLPKHILDAA